MSYRIPELVELPREVTATTVWPELAAALGDQATTVTEHQRKWLTVATLHRSALYEDRTLSAATSPACLSLLEGVGKAALDAELMTVIDRLAPGLGRKQFSERRARMLPRARRTLVAALGVATHARLGVGEHNHLQLGQPSRALESVTLQILGWWSLLLSGSGIRALAEDVHAILAVDDETHADWKTLVHDKLRNLSPTYAYTASGPDNAKVFEATVTTTDGRSGSGAGVRKKEAERLACRDYLMKYAPRLLAPPVATETPPTPNLLPILADHRRLAAQFNAPDAAVFSRAVTHFSWVFEEMRKPDRRASNEVLANLGSSILGVVAARARASYLLSETAQPDPELSTGLTVPDEQLVDLGDALRLDRICRLGAGQLKQGGVTEEMMANLVQAVLAAAYVQASGVEQFEARLPKLVANFLVEQAGRSFRDAATRLQELSVELTLEWPWTDRETGPRHAQTFYNTIRIIGGSREVVVRGAGRGRTAAKKAAAEVAIANAALRIGEAADVDRPDVALFFLERQLELLAIRPNRWPAWHQANVLGARYVANRDWTAFSEWVDSVGRAGLLDIPSANIPRHSLVDFYQQAARSSDARPAFATTLAHVLRWVTDAVIDNRVILQDRPWEDLIALTAAHSIWLVEDGSTDLVAVLESWARPERRRLPVVLQASGPADASSQAAAAVARILQEFRDTATGSTSAIRADLIPGSRIHEIHINLPADETHESESLLALLSEASPGVAIEHGDVCTTLRIDARQARSGWLWEAVEYIRFTDEYDVELASLLHDLKNEVTGARAALTRPAMTRIEQLEADLAASRHINSAAAFAARLFDARFLYDPVPSGTTNLAPFLRRYSSDLINRLPPGIQVLPPVTAPATVSVSTPVLQGVLDNLVKNAVEAMGDTGRLEFEYTRLEDDGVVLLEVRDNGPGLPDDVADALAANGPVTSSKRHGSGLGLPGAVRTIHRAGGDMEPLRTPVGCAWLIKLPLAGVAVSDA